MVSSHIVSDVLSPERWHLRKLKMAKALITGYRVIVGVSLQKACVLGFSKCPLHELMCACLCQEL